MRSIDVLAARAPGLREALERAVAEGTPHVILDGKIVDTDRCQEKTRSRKGEAIDVWYAGKTHDFGGNIQALFYPSGIPMWVSDVLPGNVHDLAAARQNVLGVLRPFLVQRARLAGTAGPVTAAQADGRRRCRRWPAGHRPIRSC